MVQNLKVYLINDYYKDNLNFHVEDFVNLKLDFE